MTKKISFTLTVYKRDDSGELYGDGAATVFKGDVKDWFGLKQASIDQAFMHEVVSKAVCHVRYTYGRLRTTVYKTPNFNGTWRE